ncbi:MAG: hypothetical protein FJ098_04605 [Deltaproteobacteria bacterium]|nr:hypothetical protein [Deltaproteobacteria bacterium]
MEGSVLFGGLDVEEQLSTGDPYLEPPENVDEAYKLYRLSVYLSGIVDALCVNVYAAGLVFTPRLPLSQPQAITPRIRASLELRKSGEVLGDTPEVSDEEVDAEIKKLTSRAYQEAVYLEGFLSRCCPDMSFLELGWQTGLDLEVSGNAYWEVLRDTQGRPARFVWVPASTVRAQTQDPTLVVTSRICQRNALDWSREVQPRRFRPYLQINPSTGQILARFKEYGDPRVMSRTTGRYYKDMEEFQASDKERYEDATGVEHHYLPANELLHFRLPYAGSHVYGRGRWGGSYPSLQGTRDLDELNKRVVTDQEIPQMIMSICGGHPGAMSAAVKRFQEQIADRKKKGERGIWIIHAYGRDTTPGVAAQTPTVEWKETKQAQTDDALGLQYKKASYFDARLGYRISRMALGDDADLNKATAMLSLRQTEEQVHDPRRDLMASTLNTLVLPELGIQVVRAKFLSRPPKDPTELANITKIFSEIGLTPDESREIAGEILGRDYKDLAGAWSRIPSRILTAILQTKNHVTAAALLGAEGSGDLLPALQEALRQEFLSGKESERTPREEVPPQEGSHEDPEEKEAGS